MTKITKATKALDTVRASDGVASKDVITTLETILGMKRTGASTYYYNAKRALVVEMREAANTRRRELRAAKKLARDATGSVDIDAVVQDETNDIDDAR